MSTTNTPTLTERRSASIRATRPLMGWRTVDLLTIAFLGAAFGVAYWAWGLFYSAPGTRSRRWLPAARRGRRRALAPRRRRRRTRRPPSRRRPVLRGLAALVSMLPGTKWGSATCHRGHPAGPGRRGGVRPPRLRRLRLAAAALAGALAAPLEAVYEWFTYWTDWSWGWKIAYLLILTASGAVIAGVEGGC